MQSHESPESPGWTGRVDSHAAEGVDEKAVRSTWENGVTDVEITTKEALLQRLSSNGWFKVMRPGTSGGSLVLFGSKSILVKNVGRC